MDIISRLERVPVGRFHYTLLAITGLGWMFDAMDTGIIAFVLPSLAKAWSLTPAQVGDIGSIGLVGMALGSMVAGTAADRFGRKRIFAATLIMYSVATGLCGLSWNYQSLLFFRFFVGFGLGGQLPVAVTLVSEYSPPQARGKFIVLLESFWGIGWLAAALVAYLLIPAYGWQIGFFIGAVPALYVFYIWKNVPESVRYLINKGQLQEAHALVSSIETAVGITPASEIVSPPPNTTSRTAFADIWAPGFFKRTMMLWFLWFGIVYSYYGIFTWLPSLMVGKGYTMIKSFESVLVMTLAQLPGYYSAAYLVDKIGRKATLAGFLAMSAVCAYFFGASSDSTVILLWGSLMSFFNLGAWGVVYTYTPELYPTRIRAFGSGWAAAIGRIGGVLAPQAVAYLIGGSDGFRNVFVMFTIVMLSIAIIVGVFGEETKGRTLDEISN